VDSNNNNKLCCEDGNEVGGEYETLKKNYTSTGLWSNEQPKDREYSDIGKDEDLNSNSNQYQSEPIKDPYQEKAQIDTVGYNSTAPRPYEWSRDNSIKPELNPPPSPPLFSTETYRLPDPPASPPTNPILLRPYIPQQPVTTTSSNPVLNRRILGSVDDWKDRWRDRDEKRDMMINKAKNKAREKMMSEKRIKWNEKQIEKEIQQRVKDRLGIQEQSDDKSDEQDPTEKFIEQEVERRLKIREKLRELKELEEEESRMPDETGKKRRTSSKRVTQEDTTQRLRIGTNSAYLRPASQPGKPINQNKSLSHDQPPYEYQPTLRAVPTAKFGVGPQQSAPPHQSLNDSLEKPIKRTTKQWYEDDGKPHQNIDEEIALRKNLFAHARKVQPEDLQDPSRSETSQPSKGLFQSKNPASKPHPKTPEELELESQIRRKLHNLKNLERENKILKSLHERNDKSKQPSPIIPLIPHAVQEENRIISVRDGKDRYEVVEWSEKIYNKGDKGRDKERVEQEIEMQRQQLNEILAEQKKIEEEIIDREKKRILEELEGWEADIIRQDELARANKEEDARKENQMKEEWIAKAREQTDGQRGTQKTSENGDDFIKVRETFDPNSAHRGTENQYAGGVITEEHRHEKYHDKNTCKERHCIICNDIIENPKVHNLACLHPEIVQKYQQRLNQQRDTSPRTTFDRQYQSTGRTNPPAQTTYQAHYSTAPVPSSTPSAHPVYCCKYPTNPQACPLLPPGQRIDNIPSPALSDKDSLDPDRLHHRLYELMHRQKNIQRSLKDLRNSRSSTAVQRRRELEAVEEVTDKGILETQCKLRMLLGVGK